MTKYFLPLITCVTLLTAVPASAATKQSDIAGVWKAYSVGVVLVGAVDYVGCTLSIDATGTIGPTSLCKVFSGQTTKVSGKFTLANDDSSTYTGTLTYAISKSSSNIQATLSPEKTVAAGAGVEGTVGHEGGISFTMVKVRN